MDMAMGSSDMRISFKPPVSVCWCLGSKASSLRREILLNMRRTSCIPSEEIFANLAFPAKVGLGSSRPYIDFLKPRFDYACQSIKLTVQTRSFRRMDIQTIAAKWWALQCMMSGDRSVSEAAAVE